MTDLRVQSLENKCEWLEEQVRCLNAELKSLREVENVTITILRERERRLAELAPLRDVAEAAKDVASGHPPFDEPRSFYRVPQNEMVLLVAALTALHAFQAKRGGE